MDCRRTRSSGDARRLPPLLSAAGVAALLAAAACSGGEADVEPEEGHGSGESDEAEVAERMADHLAAQDVRELPELLRDEATVALAPLEAPYLSDWEVYEISDLAANHPATWHVATSEEESLLLSGSPEAFEAVLGSDSGGLGTAEDAEAAAADLIIMSTPANTPVEFVEDAAGIEHRPEAAEEYGEQVAPPRAEEAGDGTYTVTSFVLHDRDFLRITHTFGPDGTITEDSETLD